MDARALHRRTDGHALDRAEQAAEALRELNHLTRGPAVFSGPAELYRLIGELALVADRFPQLLVQLDRWLRAEHDAGRVRADTGSDPGPFIAAAAAELADAGDAAHDLARVLDAARRHLAHLGATGPDPATNQEGVAYSTAAGADF